MLAAQFKAEHHFTKDEVNSSQNWFRPNNRYAYRVFASMYDKLGSDRSGLRLFHYSTLPLANIDTYTNTPIEISPITGVDLELITFVKDRPGHDERYAIDANKIGRELNWSPDEDFESGIRKTVLWYLQNRVWWQRVIDGSYQLERIGL